MNEIPISVTICERAYKLMVNPDDEPMVREAAARINDRIRSYAKNYAFNDNQDLLSMTSLQFALSALRNEKGMAYRDKGLKEQLQQILYSLP